MQGGWVDAIQLPTHPSRQHPHASTRTHTHRPLALADPDFPAPLNITYKFEQLQPMKLVVWDVDVGAKDPAAVQLASSDFLGAGAAALAVLCINRPALVSRQGRVPFP
jgi:hypothetical protein